MAKREMKIRWHTAEKFYRSENASIFACLLASKKMICLDANQGIFPLPCEMAEITDKMCTDIISTISILAADAISTPLHPTAATVVATHMMIDKCENERMCSGYNTIPYTCVCISYMLGHWDCEK